MFTGAFAPADRQVQIGLGKVDGVVRRHQHEAQLGIVARDLGQARHQPFLGQVARRGDGQRLGRLPGLHRPHRFLELEEAGTQRGKPGLGLGSQFQSLGGASEQHDAKRVLKRANLLADRRRGHRQLVRRAGKGQMPRRRVEHTQAVQGKMSPLHSATAGANRENLGIATSNSMPSAPTIR